MSLHFASPKLHDEKGRLAALYRYEILDTDPEKEFEDIIRLVKEVFGVPIAAVSLVAEEHQWFKVESGLGVLGTPRSVALCNHTIQGTKPFSVENALEHPLFASNPLVTGAPGIRCYMGVPLTTPDGYNVGSLCVIGTKARRFSNTDAAVLESFGRLVVSRLELRMLARRDGLTGALTRRAFETAAEEAVRAASGRSVTPALILFDIDYFKIVNDRFGHPAGDQVLAVVAGVIEGELTPRDRFGRLGGEEFAVLVQHGDSDIVGHLAQRVRGKVRGLTLPEIGNHRVTISAGVAAWRDEHANLKGWIAAADIALFAAKRGGRDKVSHAV